MSLAWMPPRYGSLSAKTSPGRIASTASRLEQRRQRRSAGWRACMRLVAVDWATSCPSRVEQGAGGVGALLDPRAVRAAHHDDARLLDGDHERVADHLGGDGVGGGAGRARRM